MMEIQIHDVYFYFSEIYTFRFCRFMMFRYADIFFVFLSLLLNLGF